MTDELPFPPQPKPRIKVIPGRVRCGTVRVAVTLNGTDDFMQPIQSQEYVYVHYSWDPQIPRVAPEAIYFMPNMRNVYLPWSKRLVSYAEACKEMYEIDIAIRQFVDRQPRFGPSRPALTLEDTLHPRFTFGT